MKKKPIDRFSLRYTFMKNYIGFWHWLFYRKIQSKYRSRIPKDRPVLIAPNHQLALMDAMAPIHTSRRDIIFLTRSDAFANKFIAGILRIFKMLPVYRLRDGASELAKNEGIFDEAYQALSRCKCTVGVMPEGNHGDKRRLRPLVKGIFRIAFKAQEEFGTNPGVVIIPAGLDYSSYTNFQAKLYVHFGNPIEVSEYYAEFLENPARSINSMRKRLAEEMVKGMIDIQSEEYYDMYMQLRETCNQRMRERLGFRKKDLHHRFLADKHLIAEIENAENGGHEKIPELSRLCGDYKDGVKNMGLRDWVLRKPGYPLPGLLLATLGILSTLPVFLFGALTNVIVYWLAIKVSDKIKDTQFKSTFKYGTAVFFTPVYYLVLFIAAWILTDPGWIKWAFLGSLLPAGFFAINYVIWFKKLRSLWRYQFMKIGKNNRLEQLKNLRNNILDLTEELVTV
jgi:1-acyl-sn-glycerol-3-phosphate acyltransferase